MLTFGKVYPRVGRRIWAGPYAQGQTNEYDHLFMLPRTFQTYMIDIENDSQEQSTVPLLHGCK